MQVIFCFLDFWILQASLDRIHMLRTCILSSLCLSSPLKQPLWSILWPPPPPRAILDHVISCTPPEDRHLCLPEQPLTWSSKIGLKNQRFPSLPFPLLVSYSPSAFPGQQLEDLVNELYVPELKGIPDTTPQPSELCGIWFSPVK